MKKIKDWKKFNESFGSDELDDLYDQGAEAISAAANYLATPNTEEWNDINNGDPFIVVNMLREEGSEEALSIADEIESINNQIAEMEGNLDGDYEDYEDEDYDDE
jgi:hypothetical protein